MADHALAWRPSRRLSVRAMWTLWLVCLVVTPGALLLESVPSLQVTTISSIHLSSVVIFLWVLLAWLWPARLMRNQILVLTVGLALGVQLLTRVAIDGDWLVAARVSVAIVVQAGVTLAFYRWRIGDDNLTPHRPSDIVDLAVASIIGAAVVIPLGPAPGVGSPAPRSSCSGGPP